MKVIKEITLAAVLFALSVVAAAQCKIEGSGAARSLTLGGRPFIILGGELGNSTASSDEEVEAVFPKLKAMGLNTVLAPAYWDLMEPEEGRFDFHQVDKVISSARDNGLHVVFLWFGAWKNSMSCYAPEWFKTDVKRFPRARTRSGKTMEIASCVSPSVFNADAKAFEAFVEHIAEAEKDGTVVMLQIENEIGMLESARDYSPESEKLFRSAVPAGLTSYLRKNKKSLHPDFAKLWADHGGKQSGTWEEMFGSDIFADEVFQAYQYALYVGRLADVARRHVSCPLYVNAAMNSRGRRPGQYPAAGPLAHLIDLWRAGAPSLDFISPDIYDSGFEGWVAKYAVCDNALFIPEMHRNEDNGAQAFYVIGRHNALGVSPFAIEYNAANCKLSKAYSTLAKLTPILASHPDRRGVLFTDKEQVSVWSEDGVNVEARHFFTLPWDQRATDGSKWPAAGAIVIRLAKNEYIVAGSGVVMTFTSDAEAKAKAKETQLMLGEDGFVLADQSGKEADKSKVDWSGVRRVGILSVDMVEPQEDGTLARVKRLNGDENHQGRHVRIGVDGFEILHVKLYEY